MMTIKINFINNDYTITRINGTLEEIAKYYFPRKEVKNIEILEGGEFENEFYKQTPLSIYRITEQEREEFQLYDNIRYSFRMDYKQGQAESHVTSCGLCHIA